MGTKVGTKLAVSPADWETNPESISKAWYIYYRKNDQMIKIRNMNRVKDHPGRVAETKRLIKETEQKLRSPAQQQLLDLPTSNLGLIKAITLAEKSLKGSQNFREAVASCIKYVTLSAVKLNMDQVPVGIIRKKHIKMLLQSAVLDRGLGAVSYNHYRAYLHCLFTELEELEIIEVNPVTPIKKLPEPKKFRETLKPEDRKRVREFLQEHHPEFFRFINIFFHSGGRLRELFRLQVKHVDLKESCYKVWVLKGRRPVEKKRVIKNIALEFWKSLIQDADPEWYIFGRNLCPGPKPIKSERATRRWQRHVKKKLNIDVDLYSLKHLNTDETSERLDIQHAAMQNSHTSTAVTKNHYAYGEEQRMLDRLKNLENPL